MRFFVTGATGYVGRYLIPVLTGLNHEVTTLVRPTTDREKIKVLEQQGVSIVKADISQPQFYGFALRDAIVINLAAEIFVGNPSNDEKKKMYHSNVYGLKKLFDAAIAHGAIQFIHISSRQANLDNWKKSPSFYGTTKAKAHLFLREHGNIGLPIAVITPGMVYGVTRGRTGIPSYVSLIRGGITFIPNRKNIPCTFVLDLVEAIVKVSERPRFSYREYDICTGTIDAKGLTELIVEKTGGKHPYIIPRFLFPLLWIMSKAATRIPNEFIKLARFRGKLKIRDRGNDLDIIYSDFLSSLEMSIEQMVTRSHDPSSELQLLMKTFVPPKVNSKLKMQKLIKS